MRKEIVFGGERLPKTNEEWYAYWNLIPNFDTEEERLDYIRKKIRRDK